MSCLIAILKSNPLMRLNTNSNLYALKWTVAIILFGTYSIISVNKSWNDDFRAYYQAGSAILSNVNIYDQNIVEGGFLYSPLFALIMLPLSALPQFLAGCFWYLVNVVSLVLSLSIALYLNEDTTIPLSSWLRTNLRFGTTDKIRRLTLILVLILSARFWLNSIEHGQVNLLLWCIVLASILFIRSDKVFIGSALLSLSIIIKILPLLFLFYFLLRKKYNTVILSLFWLLLFLLIPATILGWQHNLDLLAAWYHKIIEPNFMQGVIGVGDSNQSFPAMLVRFLSETSANEETHSAVNFISVSTQTIGLLTKFSSLVFIAVIAMLGSSDKEKTTQRENIELSVVFLSAVLMPMLAWKAYFVASIMGYTTIIYCVMKAQYVYNHRLLIALITGSFILHTLTADGIWGWRIAHVFQSYSCVTFSMVFLYAALILMLIKERANTIITNKDKELYACEEKR